MASTADFRNGFVIEMDGIIFRIVEFQHVKPGKGGAFVRTKLRNVMTGAVIERTFRAGEKVTEVRLEAQEAQFLYSDGDLFHLMDSKTYDQFSISADVVGDASRFMKENDSVKVLTREGRPLLIELAAHVILTVTETEPGLRGDTAQGGTKQAMLETGLTVNVPLFIEIGDALKIDTRSGEYLGRAEK
ncbi:MAG: elongation factor P [Candidatus Eisenbacteria sp.]|nr:elongation factor P [Candidatus Eisenbacteria bacterium]